ncbi:UNVERIFIED_CONTAM: hypothetical protein GTU68_007017 [Idotea baltica]|nr:hypothetical protein [Idotea baltica]
MTEFVGKVIILTAPSGAGKTTVVRHLLKNYEHLVFSISATTRDKRPYETNNVDYYFLDIATFKERVAKGDFLEWEEVYKDILYGTLKSEVGRIWSLQKHIIFDVDVEGATTLKKVFGSAALTIFVKPPSLQTLVDRLKARGTESTEDLKKRISKIRKELSYERRFDKILVNDVLEVSLKEAELMIEEFLSIKSI